jgi:hypothetical protein
VDAWLGILNSSTEEMSAQEAARRVHPGDKDDRAGHRRSGNLPLPQVLLDVAALISGGATGTVFQ